MDSGVLPVVLSYLAWAHIVIGGEEHLHLAEGLISRAMTAGERQPGNRVYAIWMQSVLLGRQERIEEAERALAEGLETTRAMPFPYMEGRMLYQAGLLSDMKGERGQARERLEEALAIFRRLGARKDAERAEAALSTIQSPV